MHTFRDAAHSLGQATLSDGSFPICSLYSQQFPQPSPDAVNSCRVSVVMPALNEAANLPHVLPRIPSWVHEVVLVDGNSTDDTVDVARRLLPTVRVIAQDGKGKGAALRTGFAAATGDVIVMLDADGSTDPAEIPAFVRALLGGADFAKGSRFLPGGGTADMSIYRALGNWGFVALARVLFRAPYSDLCYGYNAFWADAVDLLQPDGDGFEIETQLNLRALRLGLKVAEVPSFEGARITGTSHLRTLPDGWRVLLTIWSEWRSGSRRRAPEPEWKDLRLTPSSAHPVHGHLVAGLSEPALRPEHPVEVRISGRREGVLGTESTVKPA
ncbi:MAG: glycosyltransferase [Chloroflexi bacterium]|nr:glycosyltransferase [Chloroflexota bacterium]